MIISEVSPDPLTPAPRQFFANQPPPAAPRIIEEVPNNAARKTLAELFASYQPTTEITTHPPSHSGPVLTHSIPNQPSVNTNTADPVHPSAPGSSYNPTQHNGPPPRLWFPPRPPGQDIDGNTTIPDNPWTPVLFSATMEDAPCTPGLPAAPRSKSVGMPDRPRTPAAKFQSFSSDMVSSATNVPSEPAKFDIPKHSRQRPRHHSGVKLHSPHPFTEQPPTSRILATAPALPDPPTSAPKYVNPFLPRPITLPPLIPILPKSSPENVSPRTPTTPVPQFPDAPFPDLTSHPFRVPHTVHVLADWPYGPLLDTMSPRTRRFAMGGTDADGNDLKIYRPRLSRDTYLECLPPATRVEVHCTSRACGLVCELDGRAGACRRRSAAAKDAARWESEMWACEGCGEEMDMQVSKESEGHSPEGTVDACYEKDERDE